MILVLVAAFLVLLFAGIPIAYILGLVALLGISQLNSISLITVVQKMFTGLNSFTLLAVPLFVLAANIMNRAKISEKLIQFCNGIVGRFLVSDIVLLSNQLLDHIRKFRRKCLADL